MRFASRIVLRFASLIVCERLLGADNLDYFKWNSSTTQIWGRILLVFLSGPLCTKGTAQIWGHILGRICVVFLSGPLCTKGTAQIWGRIGLDLFTSSAVGHGCSSEVAVQHLEPRVWVGLASIGASTFQHFNIGSISTFQHFNIFRRQHLKISTFRPNAVQRRKRIVSNMLKC